MSNLFGGGPSAQTKGYMGDQSALLSGVRGAGDSFSGMASTAGGDAATYRPLASSSLADYAQYLQKQANPTDEQRSAYTNSQLGNYDRSYLAGQSALTNQLHQRGLSPDSSAAVGGVAALEGQRANAYGQAGAQANQYFDGRANNALSTIYGLYNNQYGQALGRQAGYTGEAAGAYGQAAGGYGNLAQQSAQEDARKQAQLQQFLGTIMQGGQLFGMGQGYGGYGQGGGAGGGGGYSSWDGNPYGSFYPATSGYASGGGNYSA